VVGIVPGEIVRNHPEFKSTAFAGSEIYEVAISLTSNIRRMPGCQVANLGDSEHASAKPRLMLWAKVICEWRFASSFPIYSAQGHVILVNSDS